MAAVRAALSSSSACQAGSALLVVARHLLAQAHALGEVLAHQRQPRAPGRDLQLRGIHVQQRREVLLAPRDDGGLGDVAAHRVDGGLELGERAARVHLRAIDGNAGAAGGGDEQVHVVEGGLAILGHLRALRGARGQLARGLDVARQLRAQRHAGGGGGGSAACSSAAAGA